MNTSNEGAIGELLVTVDLMRRGYDVFRAVSPGAICDLMIFKNVDFKRVEVTKGQRYTSSKLTGKLKWAAHDSKRYDILAVWESDGIITYMPSID